ncbi:MAG: PilZ domain-containing protein [Candidatus Omnitrophota bacterium]|nr:PilZ domain-containing protein [Candidatus Omnitrophota bacterium]
MKDAGARLIKENYISAEQLHLAQQEAQGSGKSLLVALVKLGYLTEENVLIFLAQECGIPYLKLGNYLIRPELSGILDEEFCRQNSIIPVFKINNRLFIACANPLDTMLIDTIGRITGYEVESLAASASSINDALDLCYGKPDKNFELENFIFKPSSLKRLVFCRDSERQGLQIPVSIEIKDESVLTHPTLSMEGFTRNISRGGTSIGLQLSLYLPPGIKIALSFKPKQNILSNSSDIIHANGEVIYCLMEKNLYYFIGVKFRDLSTNTRDRLIKLI